MTDDNNNIIVWSVSWWMMLLFSWIVYNPISHSSHQQWPLIFDRSLNRKKTIRINGKCRWHLKTKKVLASVRFFSCDNAARVWVWSCMWEVIMFFFFFLFSDSIPGPVACNPGTTLQLNCGRSHIHIIYSESLPMSDMNQLPRPKLMQLLGWTFETSLTPSVLHVRAFDISYAGIIRVVFVSSYIKLEGLSRRERKSTKGFY